MLDERYAACGRLKSGSLIPLRGPCESRDQARDEADSIRHRVREDRNYDVVVGRRIGNGRWHMAPEAAREEGLTAQERAIVAQEEQAYAARVVGASAG